MSRKQWITLLATILLTFSTAVFLVIHYLNDSHFIRNRILELTGQLPGELVIDDAVFRLSTFTVHGLHYTSHDSSIVADIAEIRLLLYYPNLLQRPVKLQRLVREVSLLEPSIAVRLGGNSDDSDSSEAEDTTSTIASLAELDHLEQVYIQDGRISVASLNGSEIASLSNLDSWIHSADLANTTFGVTGWANDDSTALFSLSGTTNLIDLQASIEVSLDTLDFESISIPVKDVYDVEGVLAFQANLDWDKGGWSGNGKFHLEDGALKILGGPAIDRIEFNSELKDQDVTGSGQCHLEGDLISFDGYMTLRDPIQAEVFGHAARGILGKYLIKFAELKPHEAPIGSMVVDAHLLWKPSQGIFQPTAHATSDSMQIVIGPVRDISADVEWRQDNHRMYFRNVNATWFGMDVNGSGVWRPTERKRFDTDLRVNGLVDPSELPPIAKHLNFIHPDIAVDISMRVPGRGWLITGDGRVTSTRSSDIADFSGWYTKDALEAELELYSQPQFGKVHLTHDVHKSYKWEVEGPQFLAEWYSPDIAFSGFLKELRVRGSIDVLDKYYSSNIRIEHPDSRTSLALFGMLRESEGSDFHGLFSYNLNRGKTAIGNGDFDVSYQDNILQVDELKFKDYIQAHGGYNFTTGMFDSTIIQITDLDLHDVVSRTTLRTVDNVAGQIDGKITFVGSMKKPVLFAEMELRDGSVGNLSGYWALLSASTDTTGDLRIRRGEFGKAEAALISISGGYNIPADSLHARLKTMNRNASVLSEGILGDAALLKGDLNIDVDFSGQLDLPAWHSRIFWENAEVAGILFDTIRVDVSGSTNRRLGHVVRIRECEMVKTDDYSFQMVGAVPIGQSAGLVSMNLKGNVLKVLPQITPFILEGDGQGEISTTWTVVGGEQFIIGESVVSIKDGYLRFEDVLKPVERLHVDLTIDQEGALTVDSLTGVFNETTPFEISNLKSGEGRPDPSWHPIVINDIGLDIGILKLHTRGETGLPLRIPGVNPRGEYFSLSIQGKQTEKRSQGFLESFFQVGQGTTTADNQTPDQAIISDSLLTEEQKGTGSWFYISGPAAHKPILMPLEEIAKEEPEGIAADQNSRFLQDSLSVDRTRAATAALTARESLKDQLKTTDEFRRFISDVRTSLGTRGGNAIKDTVNTDSERGLLFSGAMIVSDFRGTFPAQPEGPVKPDRRPDVIERILLAARWNVDAYISQNVTYIRDIIGLKDSEYLEEFQGFIDRISVEARIDPTAPGSPVLVSGSAGDNTLRLLGNIRSTSGTVDFLDQTFQVETVELEFDRSDVNPVVSGRATVEVLDRLGFPQTYYLTMFVKDLETGQKTRRGRWGDLTFGLEDDLGSTQEAILDSMGFSARSFQEEGRLEELGGTLIERELMRRWLRPVERDVARFLGLSHVRFDPMLTQNLFSSPNAEDLWTQTNTNSEVTMMQRYSGGTRLTLGKYVTKDLYLSYTGQIGREIDYEDPTAQGRRGYLQTWTATYRMSQISPNLVLDGRWEYDNLEKLDNRSIRIKYNFSVE